MEIIQTWSHLFLMALYKVCKMLLTLLEVSGCSRDKRHRNASHMPSSFGYCCIQACVIVGAL